MEEIFGIEEDTIVSNAIQDPLHNNDHGHAHENNIQEIEKWIVNKYIEHINISVDMEQCKSTYHHNKTIFDSILGAFLIFVMMYILYSIFKSIYDVYDESRKLKILRQLDSKKNMRKAE